MKELSQVSSLSEQGMMVASYQGIPECLGMMLVRGKVVKHGKVVSSLCEQVWSMKAARSKDSWSQALTQEEEEEGEHGQFVK